MPVTKSFLNRPYQTGPDALMPDADIDNQLAQVGPETKSMRSDEAENFRAVFPNEGQPVCGRHRVGNSLIRPPGLPESWIGLHQVSNARNVGGAGMANHAPSLHRRQFPVATDGYFAELKRFSISGQFTTLHQAAMYSGRRF
jgi:hypothetical protein